jgi:hypothetical protein
MLTPRMLRLLPLAATPNVTWGGRRPKLLPRQVCRLKSEMMLRDSYYDVRSWAAYSLGVLGEKARTAIPALCQATNDPYEGTRSWAWQALEKVENASVETRRDTQRRDKVVRFMTIVLLAAGVGILESFRRDLPWSNVASTLFITCAGSNPGINILSIEVIPDLICCRRKQPRARVELNAGSTRSQALI